MMVHSSTSSLSREGFSPPHAVALGSLLHAGSITDRTVQKAHKPTSIIKSSIIDLRNSNETLRRAVAGAREVRFMETTNQEDVRRKLSFDKTKSTDSLIIDLSGIGEDCESTRSSPSSNEHHADPSTFSPGNPYTNTTTGLTSGTKTRLSASTEFSAFNSNFHDYSAGSVQSFEFIFDLESEAEERLQGLMKELDVKLYGFGEIPPQDKKQSSPKKQQKLKPRFNDNTGVEKITMEKIASQWSSAFPHLAIKSTPIRDPNIVPFTPRTQLQRDSYAMVSTSGGQSFGGNEELDVKSIKPSTVAVSTFGGAVEEIIAEDGQFEEVFGIDNGYRLDTHVLNRDSVMNKSVPNFEAKQKRRVQTTPQSPQSFRASERIKVQLAKGFPPLDPQSAVFYEAQWEVFDSIWKQTIPKLVECFQQSLSNEHVSKKHLAKSNLDKDANVLFYGNNDILLDELENFEDDDDRPLTSFSSVTTASNSSGNSNRILSLTPTFGPRKSIPPNKELNNAVMISSFHPKPRRDSSFNFGSVALKANDNNYVMHDLQKISRESTRNSIEPINQQKQFPARHIQHFAGGFRAAPTNQSLSITGGSRGLPHKTSVKPEPIPNNDRAQTAMPSTFNKLIILENSEPKIPISNPKPLSNNNNMTTFISPSRPQTQSQFAKKNPSLANIFDVNNVNRMEQYSQETGLRRTDISSPGVNNSSTVTYQVTKRKLSKPQKPRDKMR